MTLLIITFHESLNAAVKYKEGKNKPEGKLKKKHFAMDIAAILVVAFLFVTSLADAHPRYIFTAFGGRLLGNRHNKERNSGTLSYTIRKALQEPERAKNDIKLSTESNGIDVKGKASFINGHQSALLSHHQRREGNKHHKHQSHHSRNNDKRRRIRTRYGVWTEKQRSWRPFDTLASSIIGK